MKSTLTFVVCVQVVLFLCFSLLDVSASSLQDNNGNCPGHPNTLPIYNNPPTLSKTATNGKLYLVKEVDPPLYVLHVYGSPYEMGVAHGTLLKDEITTLVPQVFKFMYEQIDTYIDWLPSWMRDLIEKYGVEAALETTILLTEEYTPQHFKDEMRGLADAVPSVTYSQFYQMMMIPELIKASCSMYGAWGKAIANTTGSLYQLRALDWNTNGPFQQFPLVTVYHPNTGNGHTFSMMSWAGFIGAITGYSSAPFGICEKVWLSYNHSSSRMGIPFPFLLRDILQFDNTMDDAIMRIEDAARTCSIWVGLGDFTNTFKAIGYSYEEVLIYDDKNFPIWKNHPRMQDLVYIDKHVQPSTHPCMAHLLQEFYGNITPTNTIRYITSVFETGDMHIALYDYAENSMYVANASPYVNGQATPAYNRAFVKLNMTQLFSEK